MSLGVCLPGGGAKGAFQAGVLEALYNRGIKKYDSYAIVISGPFTATTVPVPNLG